MTEDQAPLSEDSSGASQGQEQSDIKKKAKSAKTKKKPKAKKAVEDKPSQPKKAGSITRAFIPAFVAILVAPILALAIAWWALIEQPKIQQSSLQAQHWLAIYSEALDKKISRLHSDVERFAEDEDLLAALANADAASLLSLSAEAVRSIKHAKFLKVYADERARKTTLNGFEITYATLDLIARAQKGEPFRPEAPQNEKRGLLEFAVPVKSDDKVMAVVLVIADLNAMLAELPALPKGAGAVEIVQRVARQEQSIQLIGEARWKTGTPISESLYSDGWRVDAYGGDLSSAYGSPVMLAILAAVVALVVALLVGVSWFIARKTVYSNADRLRLMMERAAKKQVPMSAQFNLDVFEELADQLKMLNVGGLKKESVEPMSAVVSISDEAKPGNEEVDQTPSVPISLDSMFSDDEDALDVVMSDEDENFLDLGLDGDLSDELGSMATPSAEPVTNVSDSDQAKATDSALEMIDRVDAASDTVPEHIFRAYDIRGNADTELTVELATQLGLVIGAEVLAADNDAVIVGCDGRESSPRLLEALIQGLRGSGCHVIDIGQVPTPLLYYATHVLNTSCGVMVTGSHNPAQDNGFKIVIGNQPLAADDIKALRKKIIAGPQAVEQPGGLEQMNLREDYLERVHEDVILARPLKVVLDCGNGMASEIAPELLQRLGCEVLPLFAEVDGRFPNHHPDPSKPENLAALIDAVQQENADIGFAFDGDADRVGVVTRSGKIIWPDRLMMLLSKDLLSRTPGADIIFDVKCSRELSKQISTAGGRPIMWKSGHSLMRAKLEETGAILAGEMSGHIFFKDRWYGFDDGIYAASRVLEILAMETDDSDTLFAEFPDKPCTPELQIAVAEDKKFAIVDHISSKADFEGAKVTRIDGIRIDYPNAWGLLRASNTTPCLTVRFEADSTDALTMIQIKVRNELLAVDNNLDIPF